MTKFFPNRPGTMLQNMLVFWSVACISLQAAAQQIQRFNSFEYSVNEGLLQSTMNDMNFDNNNFCWLSFPNGIQKFDGINFINVALQPGLPDDKWVNFFRTSDGILLLGHARGVSKYMTETDRFTQLYRHKADLPVVFLGEDEGVVFFYCPDAVIRGIHVSDGRIVSEAKTGLTAYTDDINFRPLVSKNVVNHKVAMAVNFRLILWDLLAKKARAISSPFKEEMVTPLQLNSRNGRHTVSFYSQGGLQLYEFETGEINMIMRIPADQKYVTRCIILRWQNRPVIAYNNHVYFTNETYDSLETELVNFQNTTIGGAGSVSKAQEDLYGNLYVATVTGGVRKIVRSSYPIRYYGSHRSGENFMICLLPDKAANRVLGGTAGNGILVYDSLQRLVRHIQFLPDGGTPFSPVSIVKDAKGNYIVLAWGKTHAYYLGKNLEWFGSSEIQNTTSVPDFGLSYFTNNLLSNTEEALVQSQGWIYRCNFRSGVVRKEALSDPRTMTALYVQGKIITHSNDQLIFADGATLNLLRTVSFKNTGEVRCFAARAANEIYIGSNKGVFKTDASGKITAHFTRATGLPDECIYSMLIDKQGRLWCSSNKGIFRLDSSNNILLINKEDGLQENEFNTNVAAIAEDGEMFFGGVNGMSSFYPDAISNFDDNIKILLTRIKVNNENAFADTAVWNISKMEFPYNRNSLSFDFIAMSNSNPGQYVYQYKMDGLDQGWNQNSGLQTVRYVLPPGKYVFKIAASRYFDKNASPLKKIVIIINPPFWKSWWFIGLVFLLGIIMLTYFINQYNRRRFAHRLRALETERKMQLERERISRDLHDSIGAYANAVLYNTELLENEQAENSRSVLMRDLKFASKDIITSLRETIWALKKDAYTADECLMRIRNFVQPFNRYYPHFHFKVDGEAPGHMVLHYKKALHLVRIVQEAVTNAIKHSGGTEVHILSNVAQGRWQLEVRDNGRGFFEKEIIRGNGLDNMLLRGSETGIKIQVVNNASGGTSVMILV